MTNIANKYIATSGALVLNPYVAPAATAQGTLEVALTSGPGLGSATLILDTQLAVPALGIAKVKFFRRNIDGGLREFVKDVDNVTEMPLVTEDDFNGVGRGAAVQSAYYEYTAEWEQSIAL